LGKGRSISIETVRWIFLSEMASRGPSIYEGNLRLGSVERRSERVGRDAASCYLEAAGVTRAGAAFRVAPFYQVRARRT